MNEGFKERVKEAVPKALQDEGVRTKNPITTMNIQAAIKKLKKKLRKSSGLDGITNWMLAWAGNALVPALRALFGYMWETAMVPKLLQETRVKYIHKGKTPMHEISGYRPISLISCLGKLYTMTWLPGLTATLMKLIAKEQGAFQKGIGSLKQAWLFLIACHRANGGRRRTIRHTNRP